MRKKENYNFRKRAKETLALILSTIMVFGVICLPGKTEAAVSSAIAAHDISEDDFLVEGDVVTFSEKYGAIMYSPNTAGEDATYRSYCIDSSKELYVTGSTYYYHDYPTFTLGNENMSSDTGYPTVYKITTSRTTSDPEDSWVLDAETYPGFRVVYHYSDGSTGKAYTYFSYGLTYNDKNQHPTTAPAAAAVTVYGDVIGWAGSQTYIDSTQSASEVFVKAGDDITADDYFLSKVSGSELHLYPVYEKAESTLEISMENYAFGETPPEPVITSTNRPSDLQSNKTISYYTADREGNPGSALSGEPDTAGNYVVGLTLDDAGSNSYTDGKLTSRKYASVTAYAAFTVEKGEINPTVSVDDWEYGDTPNTPVVPEDENPGEGDVSFRYKKADEDDDMFTGDIPSEVGRYTVEATVTETDSYLGATATADFEITAKEVDIIWSDYEDIVYDGEEHCPTAEVDEYDLVGGDSCDAEVFVDGFERSYPTEPGNYSAYVLLSNSNYEPSDSTEYQDFSIGRQKIKYNAPKPVKDLTYTGKELELITPGEVLTIENDEPVGTFQYLISEDGDGDYSSEIPTAKEPGTYTVWYYIEPVDSERYDFVASDSLEVTISKPLPTITAKPEAKTGLTFNDTEQVLLATGGSVKNGTLVYGFEKDGNYSNSLPTGKDPGTYTVWYKVIGDKNYDDIPAISLTVTIEKAAPKLITKPAAKALTENGKAQELVTEGKAEHGTILYSTSEKGTYSTAVPTGTDAGNYTVWYKVNGDKNYNDISPVSVAVTIAKKEEKKEENNNNNNNTGLKSGSVTISVGNAVYGGQAPSPVVSSTTNDVSKASISYKPSGAPDSSFGPNMPTEVGTYVALVTLPANNEYGACSASCGFSISYLQVPNGAYSIQGSKSTSGWYTSQVTLTPAAGYQISLRNRQNFTNQPITLNETDAGSSFFVKKADTGEQSAAIQIATLRIDVLKPQIHDMEAGGIYFTDKNGILKGTASDRNLDKVLIDGKEVKTESDGNGNVTFDLPSGKRKQNVKVTVVDQAGNETAMEVITAPEWMRTRVIIEGDLFLEGDTEYYTPEGDETWTQGDNPTHYMGGISFYANEGDVTFHKH